MHPLRALFSLVVVFVLAACTTNIKKNSASASTSVPMEATSVRSGSTSVDLSAVPADAPEDLERGMAPGRMNLSGEGRVTNQGASMAAAGPPATPVDASPVDNSGPTRAELDAELLYPETAIRDPWERYNRRMYSINTRLDKYVARPIGVAYDKVIPDVVQHRVTAFFANLQEPRTFVNQILQGRPIGAATTLGRLLVNTTAGVGGIFDPASRMKLERTTEDFGQTLGVWGWDDSRYFVAPLLGPRTVRDFVGYFGDRPAAPIQYFDSDGVKTGLTILQLGSMRSAALPLDKMRAEAVDEYAFVRDAWMQRRRQQIEQRP
ncbi:MlaA family lipoprotein [Luteimonas suaedae]|uniref:MlaA family lipoprotein n=1 Tax=Luteimonas suaedae TaxID=2605430 RepID=UPI00165901C9|nr:VacJ family lipoprotein [Luteimonas suaedae]